MLHSLPAHRRWKSEPWYSYGLTPAEIRAARSVYRGLRRAGMPMLNARWAALSGDILNIPPPPV